MSSLPAGWYKDPADTSTQRYWDGEGWIGKAIPADAVPPDGPPPAPVAAEPAAGPPPVPAWMPPQQQGPPQGWGPPPPPPPPGWQPPPGMRAVAFPYPVEARPHGYALAGLGPRLAARLLDILAVLLLNVVVNGWFAYQWAKEFVPVYRATMEQVANGGSAFDVQPSARMDGLLWAMLIVATLLWLGYEAPAIAASGQTLGKRIMRIKVVAVESTEPLGFGRAFGRWARLGLWTPAWGCAGFGLLLQFIDSISPVFDQRLRQAFHDKTARTVVVQLPPAHQQPVDATTGAASDHIDKGTSR